MKAPRSKYSLVLSIFSLVSAGALKAEVPAAILAAVGESGDYDLIYEVAIPGTNQWGGANVPYDIDNSASDIEFDRIAYLLELDGEWVWVSFRAFTNELVKTGIPVLGIHPEPVQEILKEMNVYSNLGNETRLQTGTNLSGGNIEFWGGNYARPNALGIPNADEASFDFGDVMTVGGHGSMQIHNHGASQVIFAYNNWSIGNSGATGGLGIGSQPTGEPDWTFSGASANYASRQLYILVRPGTEPNLSVPKLLSANASVGLDKVVLEFDEALAAASATPENFTIEGLTITSATIFDDRKIILNTSTQTAGVEMTLTYTAISDEEGNTEMDVEVVKVTPPVAPILPAGVPGIGDYELIYGLEIPEISPGWGNRAIPYSVDESRFDRVGTFDRMAYLLELDGEWVFVSFNAISNELSSIGVPNALAVTEPIQTQIVNMDVASSFEGAGGVTTGTGLSGGNIEFWPGNYGRENTLGIPNASETAFDFGDRADAGVGHGSMQIHNNEASEVIFAFNRWSNNTTENLDIGIGNNPDGEPDYTFAQNSASYGTRRLYVFVRPGEPVDLTPLAPVITRIVPSVDLDKIHLLFDQPMDASAANSGNYSIQGVGITGASLGEEENSVILTTSGMQAGTDYTLIPSSAILEKGPGVQTIASGTELGFTTFERPSVFDDMAETSILDLAYHLRIPDSGGFNLNGVPYVVNEALFGDRDFERVGYALVLDNGGGEEWVFVSFDAHTNDLSKIGVPTKSVGSWQQNVSNLNVFTNITDTNRITPGLGLTGGNIEFWGFNYSEPNTTVVPNADDGTYDFGDTLSTGGGYGSLQVHNHDLSQVILAYNRWGESNTTGDIGIGTNFGGSPDWTFMQNSTGYFVKDLYVFTGNDSSLPKFEITGLALNEAGTLATISWNSLPGAIYAVDSSPDLDDWSNELVDGVESQGLTTSLNVSASGDRLFYRVRKTN
ncbi:hypothetical protein V2O64_15590 [Verrucomicrobiaceae bacterium 227]